MKLTFTSTRRHSLGISISETQLCVMLPAIGSARGKPREWQLTPQGRTDAEWPALVETLTELRKEVPRSYRSLAIALLPPLVQLRHVELPKLRPAELRLVLSRNSARYLPGVREPHTAQGVALTRAVPTQYLMAAAPVRLIEAVARAVHDSGWELTTIVPAHAAWAAAARHESPTLSDNGGEVVVPVNEHVEVLQLRGGELAGVRRLRREERSAQGGGYTLDQPPHTAAAYAGDTSGPELLPERVYVQRSSARRRTVARLAIGVAAAMLLAAAGVLVHARYVLHQVVAQRAVLQGRVGQAAKAQGDIVALRAPFEALESIETSAVVWSQVIADLTEVLPSDASLASLHGNGDSVAVAGTATRGADVFQRIDGAKLVSNVRPSAPLRRELKPDMSAVDRFEFVGRIPGTVPLYATKKKPRGKHQ